MSTAQTPPPAPVQEHRFPCDNCGSDFRYDPQAQSLICDHCGNNEQIAQSPWARPQIKELDFQAALEAELPQLDYEETRVSQCPNCAAQVELAESTHAAECPFCATPVVTDTGTHRHIKPRGLLPFSLDERSAHQAMSDWLGRLWFAPSGLQEYARKGRKMQGIYVPYWTFDANTQTTYQGERGIIYYETRTVERNGKTEEIQVAKTRWYSVRGRVARFFDDVLVLASNALPKKFTDALEPWDLSALEPYNPEYLAGFHAVGYSLELRDGFVQARAYMDRVIERDIKFDIGGDRQRIHHADTTLSNITFKHILLPVWLAAYKYRGKTYRFVVNGRTGRVQGERPYSTIKITIAVFLGLVLAAGVGYGIAISEAMK